MITHNFDVSRETFADGRKKVLTDAADTLRPHVKDALARVGLPSWQAPVVDAALDLFDSTARAEVDQWGPVIDDMRDAFAHELGEALAKTGTGQDPDRQLEMITSWVAQMAHNAGIEAATTSDPDGSVGLEWVTMHDPNVRTKHRETDGQTVPTGHEFDVGGVKMLYPGQPVGDPSNWINCRCLARPTMLSEASAKTITASAAAPNTQSVIVALPADTDPVTGISSEDDGAHCTLLFLGDATAFNPDAVLAVMAAVADGVGGPVNESVSGPATLGPNKADVVLLDAAHLADIRGAILAADDVRAVHDGVEQFPTWIPHVTLGYPDTPRLSTEAPAEITFDRLALWHGEDRTNIYPLGGNNVAAEKPKKDVIHPEDPGFTQEMADAFFAATDAQEPAAAAPAADAPAPAEEFRPWHGVLAPEGTPSGDNRGFAAKMLTTRDLPLPLKAQFVDDEGHKGSVIVGRIDEVYRDGGLIKAAGVWDNSPEADKAWTMIDRKMWRGVSVDLDSAEGEMIEAADGEGSPSIEFSQGRVCSSTLCAIPAFAEAFIRNGTWADFANEPMPSGAMVEIPDWTEADKTPPLALVASAAPVISADYFRNPGLEEPTPVTRGEDGHIFGHLGIWEQCHIAYQVCTTVPPSETDYAYFLTGQVFTDAGPVAVGQLTVGGGHADMKLGIRAALAHYDNVASAVADITVGEDAHGVWFSGKIRPWATEQQIHELFAAGPSGDWRGVRYRGRDSMELVAAHAVNVPGFPIPRAKFAVEGTRQVSLVAAGMPDRGRLSDAAEVLADLRGLEFSHINHEITTLKGK